MYELTVEREFRAAHAIVMDGEREESHEHTWRVTVAIRGAELDAEGLLCDFHALERTLDEVVNPLREQNLNEVPPFKRTTPTAELVAKHIADRVMDGLPDGVSLLSARVVEAPGCTAAYYPDEP